MVLAFQREFGNTVEAALDFVAIISILLSLCFSTERFFEAARQRGLPGQSSTHSASPTHDGMRLGGLAFSGLIAIDFAVKPPVGRQLSDLNGEDASDTGTRRGALGQICTYFPLSCSTVGAAPSALPTLYFCKI